VIDTSNIERRPLRFERGVDVIAEAERIARAERAGRLRRSGNWTAGQCFGHLAGWIGFCFDGYPVVAPPELAARAQARKPVALKDGLRTGFYIPDVEGGTAAIEVLELDEGLARLQNAWARLESGMPRFPHPFFGALTYEEWLMLHLRHAELHMSCLHPETP
jgi:hypothetical protein